MAKFYGKIGYAVRMEIRPGVWDDEITEREYFGDLLRNTSRYQTSEIFRSVTMLHDRINECAWISSSQNKAQFINNAMYYICSCLFKLTGTNGK